MSDPLATALRARLVALREQLAAEYGWTHLDPTITLAHDRVTLTGHVPTLALATRIRQALADTLPPAITLDLALAPLPILAWHELQSPITSLWRRHPSAARHELATELHPSDGPIALLARDRGATLVRARDGTSGWTLDPLGDPTPPRRLIEPHDHGPQAPARLLAAARTWLGTPYVLGGASRAHIDCSALVQRAFVDALGLLVPRNSNDQLACVGGDRRDDRPAVAPGDLLFIRSRREQRTHVGLAGERGTVVQASRTRSMVVEIALADYLLDAAWMVQVPLVDMLAWARTQVGRDAIELPVRL